MIATAISTALLAALSCDLDQARFIRTPDGATTNGTLQAKDVPGATAYTTATKRLTGDVCAAMYGLREAQIMRKVFPLATGEIAGWGALQKAMPDLTAFDLCPTNYADETYSEKPEYRYFVTPTGTRCLSWEDAELGSVWNANGGTRTGTNHVAKTGAYDLITPPASNRVFRTPRLTAYLKRVVDTPIDALKAGTWQKMCLWDPDGIGGWLDPTIDHASLVTGNWCADDSTGLVTDYAQFLKSLCEYRNDADATNMTGRCAMFGGERLWKGIFLDYGCDYYLRLNGFPNATARFEAAEASRKSGKITDMIALAAPGLKASITSDWQKAVQKIAASQTTRLWWQRQALANGIVALQSQLFVPLGCVSMTPSKSALINGMQHASRLPDIRGKERYAYGSSSKTEYYKIPTDAITVGRGITTNGPYGIVAYIDASKLEVTNTVTSSSIIDDTSNAWGSGGHEAHWEQTGNSIGIGLYATRPLQGQSDLDYCLPNEPSGPNVVKIDELSPGASKEYDLSYFRLVNEKVETGDRPEYVFKVYTSQGLPSGVANQFVQNLNVPVEKWTGDGQAAFSLEVDARAYWSSPAPSSWIPWLDADGVTDVTPEPIAYVTEGSKLADMIKADIFVVEYAQVGTNAWSRDWRYRDDEDGPKNAWLYSRLSAPFKDIVPAVGPLKDVTQWAFGADSVKNHMAEVLGSLPDSDAGDPYDWSELKAEVRDLKNDVADLFPKTRQLLGQYETEVAWKDTGAWVYVLKRSEGGAYSAEWKCKREDAVAATLVCGATEQTSRPLKHSKWINYYADTGMILKFTFPFMNFDADQKEAK